MLSYMLRTLGVCIVASSDKHVEGAHVEIVEHTLYRSIDRDNADQESIEIVGVIGTQCSNS